MFVKRAVMFIGKGSLAIVKLFKAAKAGAVDNIKRINGYNLRQWLIIYKLKGPLLLIYSLIFIFNHFIELSL